MLSRILWILAAGIALVAGMLVQDRWIFGWTDQPDVSAKTEQAVEARVERAIDRSFDKMQVVGPDGSEIDVPGQTKRALAEAVGRLVKAETELAVLRISDGRDEEMQAARARSEQARADVDRLKTEIKRLEKGANRENDALREQIRQEIREDIRASVRDSVRS